MPPPPRSNHSSRSTTLVRSTLTVTAVTQGTHGAVTFSGGSVTYTPAADYNGTDSFSNTSTDDSNTNSVSDPKSATATVSITVTKDTDAPTAEDDSATHDRNG